MGKDAANGEHGEEKENHYRLLQVQPHAEAEVIAAAGKALLAKYHPDKGQSKEYFSKISTARDTLADSQKRADYDAELRAGYNNVIGNYRLIRKISEGGFGRVFEAEHTFLHEKVCIKHNLKVSPLDAELFIKEAKAIWDLRHHALPAMRDMFMLDDGSFALVMSYVEGPTLEQVVSEYAAKKKSMDPENACWMMERILDALRYVHYHGVVHGDVKPQNIIVQPEQHTCVLVDFGLCTIKPNSSSRPEGYTQMFASPEALQGVPLLPESDLYSLGLTMIYALGGDPRTRRVPKDIPVGVRDFISDLIIYDVTKRPHWDNVDLVQKLRDVRIKEFNREHTNFKKL